MIEGATRINPWFYWSLWPAHRLLMATYWRSVQIQGQENIPPNGPMVFACKHFSRWDPLVLGLALPLPLYFMTEINQFQGVQGGMIRQLGGFPVDRQKPDKASLKTTLQLLQAGQRLVIFPEGGITRDAIVGGLKLGLARIVLQAETLTQTPIPILPVALKYHPDAVARAEVSVLIDRPIWTKSYVGENSRAIGQAMTQDIAMRLNALLK
jgi:1-acyl-sn-glycerol-3-phosphate acyltransferase